MIGSIGLYLAYALDILITVARDMARSRKEISIEEATHIDTAVSSGGVGPRWPTPKT